MSNKEKAMEETKFTFIEPPAGERPTPIFLMSDMTIAQPPPNITFENKGEIVGKIWWDDKLHFEGNVDESGRIFFEWMERSFHAHIERRVEEEYQRRMNH